VVVDGFEAAWGHCDESVSARRDLSDCWSALCDLDCFHSEIVLEDDGSGRLDVLVDWPDATLERANEAALRFASHVKRALDEALLAAAAKVSGAVQIPDPAGHVMPLCKSNEELEAHLQGGGLQGLRPDQIRVVRQLQPYEAASEDADPRLITTPMAHLAQMLVEPRAAGRPRVAVWAHSASPEVVVNHPGVLRRCDTTGDGVLEQTRTVASFTCDAATSRDVFGNPNIAFDLIFNDAPYPSDPDDNLMARSTGLIALAREFIRTMQRSVVAQESAVGPRQSAAAMVRALEGSAWQELDPQATPEQAEIAAALATSDFDLAQYTDASGNVSMLLRSGASTYMRPIPPATALDPRVKQGTAAEQAALAAASRWGLPDFLMRPRLLRKGAATREVGDGTIISGRRGLSIQVKSREATPDDPEREARWLNKNVAAGARQARGTIRSLRAGPLELVNGRGRTVHCDGAKISWAGVVIVDHPSPPEIVATVTAAHEVPVVALLRRDWDFLFDQLRSVSAVADYIHRISSLEPKEVGREFVRYYELARADDEVAAKPSQWITDLGASPVSRPILPKTPPSSGDSVGHTMFRIILEEIAAVEIDRDEAERLRMLALIDRFNVSDRADLGRLLLTRLDEVMTAPTGQTMWRFRRVVQDDGGLQLAFGVCSQLTPVHREAFSQWAMLRHNDFMEKVVVPAGVTQTTVAVLLTPRYDRFRPWDTTVVAMDGELGLEAEELAAMGALWNRGSDAQDGGST
jgi:hypothetical protein